MKRFELELTKEQRKLIAKAFGQEVESIKMSVEEFPADNREAGSLRVLKIENVAAITSSIGQDSVVN